MHSIISREQRRDIDRAFRALLLSHVRNLCVSTEYFALLVLPHTKRSLRRWSQRFIRGLNGPETPHY